MSNKLKFALLSTLALSSATFGSEAVDTSEANASASLVVARGQNSPYDGLMGRMVTIMSKHVTVESDAPSLAQQTTKAFAALVKAHVALKSDVAVKVEELATLGRQLEELRGQLTALETTSAERVRGLETQVQTLAGERDAAIRERDAAIAGARDAAAAAAELEGLDEVAPNAEAPVDEEGEADEAASHHSDDSESVADEEGEAPVADEEGEAPVADEEGDAPADEEVHGDGEGDA